MRVLILRGTVAEGKQLEEGQEVELNANSAKILILLGKAKKVEPSEALLLEGAGSLTKKKKEELSALAESLNIELEGDETKAELIELIEAFSQEE